MKDPTFRASSPKREERQKKDPAELPPKPVDTLEGKRIKLSSKHPFFYYYNKSARAKWNRASQVVEGMRWNAYKSSGKETPLPAPLAAPELAPLMAGRMRDAHAVREEHAHPERKRSRRPHAPAQAWRNPAERGESANEPETVVHIRVHERYRPLRIAGGGSEVVASVSQISSHPGFRSAHGPPAGARAAVNADGYQADEAPLTANRENLSRPQSAVQPAESEPAPENRPHIPQLMLLQRLPLFEGNLQVAYSDAAPAHVAEEAETPRLAPAPAIINQAAPQSRPTELHEPQAEGPMHASRFRPEDIHVAKGPGYLSSAAKKVVQLKVTRADALPPGDI